MTKTPKRDQQLVQVLAAIRNHVGPGRSPLYRWMRQRHDALAAAFDETPPAWAVLAAAVADQHITDADGKPPSPQTARQTWYRVRRDVAARARRVGKSATLAPGEIAPGVRAAFPPSAGDTVQTRIPLDIRPTRTPGEIAPGIRALPAASFAEAQAARPVRGGTQGVGASAATSSADQTGAERLQRLREQMHAGKVPVPKPL